MIFFKWKKEEENKEERPCVPQKAPPNSQENYKMRPRDNERALHRSNSTEKRDRGQGFGFGHREVFKDHGVRNQPRFARQGTPYEGKAPIIIYVASYSATCGR